jgi:phosphotransferase system enzyme I (PtsI)
MKTFTGIPASSGIAIGKAFIFSPDEQPEIPHYSIRENQAPAEWMRLQKAAAEAAAEIKTLYDEASRTQEYQADILQAHILMLEDPFYLDQLKENLYKNFQNSEWVVNDVSLELSSKLLSSQDIVFQERAVDIADVSRRIINCLQGNKRDRFSLEYLVEDVILVAHDLMPSDAMMMNGSRVKGLVMDQGSRTCHTAILARAFNIPAVLGLSVFSKEVKDGEMLIVDGSAGSVFIEPDEKTLLRQKNKIKQYRKHEERLISLRDLPAVTTDGHRVTIEANIEFPQEAEHALQSGADGIGLYRSEFLFISSGAAADEETQFNAYSQVLKTMGKKPVTIRTADLGGDKMLAENTAESEKNPLLGWRAIRISLSFPEVFKAQLRAILRAGVHGNARIMFPMISGIEELEHAIALLKKARAECRKKNQPIAKKVETGIMIEIPSAAVTAGILAEKSDFFSIGTNDLVQYTFAADRGNEKVNHLGDPFHPAALRLIKQTIDAAHKKGIKAAMCGELAGDPDATALLLGLGLDEFSMNASSIPEIKQIIRKVSFKSCKALAAKCLAATSVSEIRKAVKS